MTRRTFGKAAAAVVGAPLLMRFEPASDALASVASSTAADRNGERAMQAYRSMQDQYYVPAVKLYRAFQPPQSGNTYSYVWPYSQALHATLDLLGLAGGASRYRNDLSDRVEGLAAYWNPAPHSNNPPSPPVPPSPPGYASYVVPPLGQGGDLFYDDNEWIGLAAIQQNAMSSNPAALDRAKAIFEVVRYGWDTDTTHADPGGTFWTQAPWSHDRNTISNGPGAVLGLHLYLITKDVSYLQDSMRMLDWANRNLRAPNGLYWDHVDLQGNIETTQWSYNQGVMLEASALVYQATGKRTYLHQALDTADRALDFYTQGGRLYTQDVIFNAIFFRSLLFLHSIQSDNRYRQALQSYADTLWQVRDSKTGLLKIQPYKPLDLIVQAGLVQLYAMLGWSPSDYGLLV